MAKRKVLVTGAAGFIAYHLIEKLLVGGNDVTGIDNFDPFYSVEIKRKNISDLRSISEKTGSRFDLIEKDLNQLNGSDFGSEFDTVVHLAAKAGVRPSIDDPLGYVHANIVGTARLLDICQKRGWTKIVFASSSSVYGNDSEAPFKETSRCERPISPYASTKRSCELLCANYADLYQFTVASLRFFTVYGPRQRPDLAIHKFSKLILEGKEIPFFGDGSMGRDFTYVGDTTDGVIKAIEWVHKSPGGMFENFNFGNSAPVLLSDMVTELERGLGMKAKIKKLPPQPGDVNLTFADISKSKRILGYDPKTPFAKGIEIFSKWVKSVYQ